jgi:glycosyltransferase involved in cell wall biosynthesis
MLFRFSSSAIPPRLCPVTIIAFTGFAFYNKQTIQFIGVVKNVRVEVRMTVPGMRVNLEVSHLERRNGLSLIIPIYNVEDYIDECLQSVTESMGSLPNIQIILVDDGTPDNSGWIAKKYADAHSNFLYLRKENGGLSDARNYGLEFVEHNYVGFLDSDDRVGTSFFKKIFEALEKQPDLVVYDYLNVKERGQSEVVKGMDRPEILWTVQSSAWNKIYHVSLFEHIKFPKGKVFEDVGTVYKLLYYVDNYVYIGEYLYNYRNSRSGSILSTVSHGINDIYTVLEDTYQFYSENDALTGENQVGLGYQYVKLLGWSNMYRQLQYFKYDFCGFHRKMNETRLLLYKRFPDWKHNEYLKRNELFFEERLGGSYIHKLDRIGKTPLSTFHTIVLLLLKNRKRIR